MRLIINGEERNYAAATLELLIAELGMKGDRVAVELNREIVPRANWSTTALEEGDRLEIVHFVGGGLGPRAREAVPARGEIPKGRFGG